MMRYSLYEIDNDDVVATTDAADRDEAIEWFSEKLRLMLTFEGDPADPHAGSSTGFYVGVTTPSASWQPCPP
jgi:hypothetical protein